MTDILEQLASLQSQQDFLKKCLAKLTIQFNQLKEQVNENNLSQAIAGLQAQIIELQSRIAALERTPETPIDMEVITDSEDTNIELSDDDEFDEAIISSESSSLELDDSYESDEVEFKRERILLLVGFYFDEPITTIGQEEFIQLLQKGHKDFTGYDLSKIDFSYVSFFPVGICFNQANLKEVIFYGHKFHDSQFILADLENVVLRRAVLERTRFDQARLVNTNFRSANLYRSILYQANAYRANFQQARLELANLNQANLMEANLSECNLKGAWLIKANLSYANLQRANLFDADLEGANLKGVNLEQALCNDKTWFPTGFNPQAAGAYVLKPGADLFQANLTNTDLRPANLRGANLSEAKLMGANLGGADLTGANLTNADLKGTDLTAANLTGADLRNAEISVASLNIHPHNLKGMIMPDGSIYE